jgi:hypothetical protein
MSRTRLTGAALLFLAFLPGCGALTGDRRTLCERWRDCWNGNRVEACPTGYPVVEGGCAMPIPTGGPYQGAPIYMGGPGASIPSGAETFPPPGGATQIPPARIPPPKIGIDEGKGKQFELDGRTGPIGPALPVSGVK